MRAYLFLTSSEGKRSHFYLILSVQYHLSSFELLDDNLFLSPFDSVWGGASDECIEVSLRISLPMCCPSKLCAFLCVRRRGDLRNRAARRMEDANNGTVCTPRRRFAAAQRRATAIAAHVDARARDARSEESAPVGDDGAAVAAFAARFARRAVADAVAAR